MIESPNPTAAEMRETRNAHTGRLSLAGNEICRRVMLNLPARIADFNLSEGHTPKNGVQMISSIEVSPAEISDTFLMNASGKAFVSLRVVTSPLSQGATYQNEIEVTISVIDAPITSANQVAFSWERIELIRDVLFHFLSATTDAQGRVCWKLLEPTGYARLNAEIRKWSGVAGTWRMLQVPGAAVFPVPV